MWVVQQIFDGEYGCEERQGNEKLKCLVILKNESGEQKQILVEDEWLTEKGIEEGSVWLEEL